jgi:hypothetical protein
MKLLVLALISGASAAVMVYLGARGEWVGREAVWAVPIVLAVLSLGALLKDEDNRVKRAQARRRDRQGEKVQHVERQQPHGQPYDEGSI